MLRAAVAQANDVTSLPAARFLMGYRTSGAWDVNPQVAWAPRPCAFELRAHGRGAHATRGTWSLYNHPMTATTLPNPLRDTHDQGGAEFQPYADLEIVSTFGEPQAEYSAIRKGCGMLDTPQ